MSADANETGKADHATMDEACERLTIGFGRLSSLAFVAGHRDSEVAATFAMLPIGGSRRQDVVIVVTARHLHQVTSDERLHTSQPHPDVVQSAAGFEECLKTGS